MKWLLIALVGLVVFYVLFGQSAWDWAYNLYNGGAFKPGASTHGIDVPEHLRNVAMATARQDDVAP